MISFLLMASLGQFDGGLPAAGYSQRRPLPESTTLLHDGVLYEVSVFHTESENRTLVHAVDAATGFPLWAATLFEVPLDFDLNSELQNVGVVKMWVERGGLMAENELGEVYRMSLSSHGSSRVKNRTEQGPATRPGQDLDKKS